MTKVITVYPVPGRLILMPDRGFQSVPKEGASVALDSFYTRALMQGDLTETPLVLAAPAAEDSAPSASADAPESKPNANKVK